MTDTTFQKFSETELDALQRLRQYVTAWCGEHQCAIGVAEMALGAALVAIGWQNGAMQMGVDFVAHKLNPGWASELTAAGAGVTGLATYFLGNVGLAAAGTAMCVPALALAGGAALVFGLAGYGAAKLVENFLHHAPNLGDLLTATSLAAVGVCLLVDGARRIPAVRETVARVRDAGMQLVRVARDAVIDSVAAFTQLAKTEITPFLNSLNKSGLLTALAGAASFGTAGAVVAPSFATLAGSSTLGSAAVGLGLMSAPVWPIVAGVGVGIAATYGVLSWLRRTGAPATGAVGRADS